MLVAPGVFLGGFYFFDKKHGKESRDVFCKPFPTTAFCTSYKC